VFEARQEWLCPVAHILEISDGKLVRFDQCVDSATINPIISA
jgi:hypothetical protein